MSSEEMIDTLARYEEVADRWMDFVSMKVYDRPVLVGEWKHWELLCASCGINANTTCESLNWEPRGGFVDGAFEGCNSGRHQVLEPS